MTKVHVNVCIVGGGPAGLMLGLLLAKRGAEVLVLEGHANFDREYRGEVLQPSTAHLLDELGLLEYILEQPHSLLEAGKVRLRGKRSARSGFRDRAGVSLRDLDAAAGLPGGAAAQGRTVPVVHVLDGRARLQADSGRRPNHGRCRCAQRERTVRVRADVVIGADGRFSTIAKLGGFTAEYEHHDFDIVWFTIPQPPGWSSTLYVSLGGDVRGLMLPKYPHHIQAGIALPTGEWKRWKQKGLAFVASKVRQFDPIFAEFADSLQDFTPFFPLDGTIRFISDWARDGCC
jgi:2-polyprenyl-6-methoxyphenol hydroxylase-like FAD-dependent oxidoreductase